MELTNQQRKRWLIRLTIIFLSIGLFYLIHWLWVGQFYEKTDDAYVSGNPIQVMPQISGHVTEILADETDLVVKGQPLIQLDKIDAYIALKNAEAQLALTARQVSQLYQNVHQLQSSVQIAQDNFKRAQEDYQRRQELTLQKTISIEELRHAKLTRDSAAESLTLAQNQLLSATALVKGTHLYQHPQVQQAIVNLRNAYLTWMRTIIYAPETGYVAKRFAELGQEVNPNTALMIIVPLHQLWVNANFKESQLKNMRIGQPAQLISDAYGSSVAYQGTVIGLNPGTGNAFDLLPPQNATGNWIKIIQRLPVRIDINPEQLRKYPLRIGLSMTVTIDTHKHKGSVLTLTPQKKILYQTTNYTSDLTAVDQLVNQILRANANDDVN